MEIPAIHGWNMPLVVENRDEMYGRIHGRSCHPWMFLPSMDRMGLPMECIIYYYILSFVYSGLTS